MTITVNKPDNKPGNKPEKVNVRENDVCGGVSGGFQDPQTGTFPTLQPIRAVSQLARG